MNRILAFTAIAALAACAQQPDAIAPAPMGNAYAGTSCQDAVLTLSHERQALDALSARQRKAAAGDAFGVFLIGLPLSTISGSDVSPEIAASKGRIMALEARIAGCMK